MNVKIPAAKDEPKQLLPAKTPVWFTRVSASERLNDHRSVLPNNFLILGTLPKSCLKLTDLNYVY